MVERLTLAETLRREVARPVAEIKALLAICSLEGTR
jgi:hypothetical protein